MNIPHKFFINNCISTEKIKFYEKLPNRYLKIITEYLKRKPNQDNFHKKVMDWLFSQEEEIKMILCSVENKKYTNTIYEAYNYYINNSEDVKFKITKEDSYDSDKFKLDYNDINFNKFFNKNNYSKVENIKKKKNLTSVHNKFLNYLLFYQCETPINDYDNYSSYFTLSPKFLQNEEIFNNECNEIANHRFLTYPIEIIKDPNNKSNYIFDYPKWIKENNENNLNPNYPYDTDEKINLSNNNYFTLAQYILSLIDQVLSIRYILYKESQNLKEIITSTYLYDLFDKKKSILSYINSINIDLDKYFKYFQIEEINEKIFFSQEIEKFVENKKKSIKKTENSLYIADEDDSAFTYIEKIFENILEKNKNDKNEFTNELVDMCMLIHINKLFTIDDFFLRTIFEKFYTEYLNQICNEIVNEEEKRKKRKKKKKKNNNINNENNILDNIDDKEEIFNFTKKLILDNLEEKLKKINENNIINNKRNISFNKKEKRNKKQKEFFLYEPIKKKDKKKRNNSQKNNSNIHINNNEKKNTKPEDNKSNEINEDGNINNIDNINNINHISTNSIQISEEFLQKLNISKDNLKRLNDDINNFNKDIESLLIIFRKIKKEIKNHFELIIKNIYENNSQLETYGSSLYQLDIESSDLDLSISTQSNLSLDVLAIYLSNNNQKDQYINIKHINTASIPIIKLEVDYLKLDNDKINEHYNTLINNNYYKICINNNIYKEFNIIKVDISLKSINYKQINFIQKGINIFPQIKPLIKIIKKLLIFKNMNNSYKGGMSSYCLFLIIYSYLKINNNNNNIIGNNNYGSLLMDFLYYYINCVDFAFTVIDPNLENPFIISTFPIETIPTIIDPVTMKNAGKIIFRIIDVVNALNEIYKDILFIINNEENNGNIIYKLFHKYVENR